MKPRSNWGFLEWVGLAILTLVALALLKQGCWPTVH